MTKGVRVWREFRVFSLQEAESRYSSLQTCERLLQKGRKQAVLLVHREQDKKWAWIDCGEEGAGLDLRKLSPVGAHHGNRLSRLTAGLPGQNKSCKHLVEQVVLPLCRAIACLASGDLIQAFFPWLSDAIIKTFALPMCLYPQLEMPTPKFMGCLPVPTIQSVVILLKVPAEMLTSAICTWVLLASVYLQKNWDQLMHNMASDHYKEPETNQKGKESLQKNMAHNATKTPGLQWHSTHSLAQQNCCAQLRERLAKNFSESIYSLIIILATPDSSELHLVAMDRSLS